MRNTNTFSVIYRLIFSISYTFFRFRGRNQRSLCSPAPMINNRYRKYKRDQYIIGCPKGWTMSGSKCYFTQQYKATYSNAITECAKLAKGGTLAETRDSVSLAGVIDSIKQAKIPSKCINYLQHFMIYKAQLKFLHNWRERWEHMSKFSLLSKHFIGFVQKYFRPLLMLASSRSHDGCVYNLY